MSARATLDGVQFAAAARRLEGEFDVAALPRLRDLVHDHAGTVRYRFTGHQRADGKPAVRLEVSGAVRLTCQRCLDALEQPVDSTRELVFVEQSGLGDIAEEEAETDYLDAGQPLDVEQTVEDEVMLCLPMAPRHAADQCPAGGAGSTNSGKPRPFAVLSQLKKH